MTTSTLEIREVRTKKRYFRDVSVETAHLRPDFKKLLRIHLIPTIPK